MVDISKVGSQLGDDVGIKRRRRKTSRPSQVLSNTNEVDKPATPAVKPPKTPAPSTESAGMQASGHKKVMQFIGGESANTGSISRINPDECWHDSDMHNRILENVESDEKYQELFSQIEQHGQQEPGRVWRKVNPNNPKQRYLLVTGARRWYIASKLGTTFKTYILDMTEQQYYIAMHLENIGRSDISAYEAARNMVISIESGAFMHVTEYSERMGVPATTCYRYERIGSLPKMMFPAWVQLNKLPASTLEKFSVGLKKLSDGKRSKIVDELSVFTPKKDGNTQEFNAELKRLTKLISNKEAASPTPVEKVNIKLEGKATAVATFSEKGSTLTLKGESKNKSELKKELKELIAML